MGAVIKMLFLLNLIQLQIMCGGKNWGNTSGVDALALALDFQNNIYTMAYHFGTCDFDPDPINSYALTANVYGTDAYMFKLSCTLYLPTVTTTSNIIQYALEVVQQKQFPFHLLSKMV